MARLVSATDTDGPMHDVDFGLIYVVQEHLEWPDPFESGRYAVSQSGMVKLTGGTKYAQADVRVKLWDDDPGPPGYPWEEYDEVPFEEAPGAGALVVQDFVGTNASSRLEIDGLGRARVGVAARGRRRGLRDEQLPESWLVRLWPDRGSLSAFDGVARRSIAPPGYLVTPDPPWHTVMSGFGPGFGWVCHAAERLWRAMYEIAGPCTREEIAAMWGVQETRTAQWLADVEASHPVGVRRPFYSESVLEPARWDGSALGLPDRDVLVAPAADDDPFWLAERQRTIDNYRALQPRLDELAERAGMEVVATYDDVLDALVRIGAVAVCGPPEARRFVPSPALIERDDDPPISTYAHPPDGGLVADLAHLLHWESGKTARWTPTQVAYRLGEPVPELVQMFEALRHQDRPWPPLVMDDPGQPVAADTVLDLSLP